MQRGSGRTAQGIGAGPAGDSTGDADRSQLPTAPGPCPHRGWHRDPLQDEVDVRTVRLGPFFGTLGVCPRTAGPSQDGWGPAPGLAGRGRARCPPGARGEVFGNLGMGKGSVVRGVCPGVQQGGGPPLPLGPPPCIQPTRPRPSHPPGSTPCIQPTRPRPLYPQAPPPAPVH